MTAHGKYVIICAMETFKVTVCTAMLCAVTAVFAWDVEHDEIARLTGEALPTENRAFY